MLGLFSSYPHTRQIPRSLSVHDVRGDGRGHQGLLLQEPTFGKTHTVVSSGDLWSVPRAGGEAARLTVSAGLNPKSAFPPMERKSPSPANATATSMCLP